MTSFSRGCGGCGGDARGDGARRGVGVPRSLGGGRGCAVDDGVGAPPRTPIPCGREAALPVLARAWCSHSQSLVELATYAYLSTRK